MLSGKLILRGLTEEVIIKRDSYGVPMLSATSRLDLTRAIGFLHGQERFFQMDLIRRMAAGELSELFGEVALEVDKLKRLHRFRSQVSDRFSLLSPFEKELLYTYAEGVNAGLQALQVIPFEYLLLRENPAPWRAEDALLVGLGLFFDLQEGGGSTEALLKGLQSKLPPEVYTYFTQNGSHWDAPLDGTDFPILPIPPKEQFAYLNPNTHVYETMKEVQHPPCQGSNQWAIQKEGKAFLACDMHLELMVPNIWYRMSMCYVSENQEVRVDGITLPGTPIMVIGSNGHIAWGFTNGYLPTCDLISIDEADPKERYIERIHVKGGATVEHLVEWVGSGPVLPNKIEGRRYALRWIAHDLDSFNFGLVGLERARSVEGAFELLPHIEVPILNFMVADRAGHIGWSYMGSALNQKQGDFPVIQDPPNHILWSANNRVIKNDGNFYLNPIRAFQIRKRLLELEEPNETHLFSIQLDDEALFFDRWFNLLSEHLNGVGRYWDLVKDWDHHSGRDSSYYFWIREFRERLMNRVASRLLSVVEPLHLLDLEESIYQIVLNQPEYLVDPRLGSWKAEFDFVLQEILGFHGKGPLNWGQVNQASIRHPLSEAVPILSSFLDMTYSPLSGDYYVPLVSSPTDGASVRLVVSPGHESEAIINVPGGQSGHPLSPHYRDQHGAWLEGSPLPLLPQKTLHTLILSPEMS